MRLTDGAVLFAVSAALASSCGGARASSGRAGSLAPLGATPHGPEPPAPICGPDQIADVACVRVMGVTRGGPCPGSHRVQGKFEELEAPLDVTRTDYNRRTLFGDSECCYGRCSFLPVRDAADMRGRELTCGDLYPLGDECFDVSSGPSRFPASAQYPECASGLSSASVARPGAWQLVVFSSASTGTARARGRRNACCYSFCEAIPGVSYE